MNLLIDTHLLLWAGAAEERLPPAAYNDMADTGNSLYFSVVSIWEIAIKRSLNRADFRFDPSVVRAGLFQMGYEELPIESRNVLGLVTMPHLHSDPFDRLLLAQAISEGVTLLTADRDIARYDGPIRFVG